MSPVNGKYLLDTNVVIRLFERDPAIERRLEANQGIAIPVVVLGELFYGARKSLLVQDNCQRIEELAAHIKTLDVSIATAREYGIIKNELRLKGRMIPENDLWIAAMAREFDLTLVSSDRHFAEVDKLQWEQW